MGDSGSQSVRPLVIAFALLLSGCAATVPAPTTLSLPEPSEVVLIPGDRPAIATAVFHETADEAYVARPDVTGAHAWEPRDVPLTFHGIHPVYDEWGRPVPAFVFRYEPMELFYDEITFGPSGVQISGHYEAVAEEYAFDATDGRFLGPVFLDYEFRYFSIPQYRDALVWGFDRPLMLFMMMHAQQGRLGERVPIGPQEFASLQPYTGWMPFSGECTAYQLRLDDESFAADPPSSDDVMDLACFDEGSSIPLWAWQGTQAKGGVGYQRLDAAFVLPPVAGAPLAPMTYDALEFVPGPDVGVGKPIHTPPTSGGSDWADNLAQRVVGLYTDPNFLTYAAQQGDLYLENAAAGWPPSLPGPLAVLPQPDPLFDDAAWLFTTDGEGFYWGFVKSRWAGPEQRDVHVMERDGANFDFGGGEYPELSEVRSVPIGGVVSSLPDIAPVVAQGLQYYVLPKFPGMPMMVDWFGYGSCFTAAAKQSQVAGIDGISGALFGAGLGVSTSHGCGSMLGGMYTYLEGDNPTLRPVRDGARHGILVRAPDLPPLVQWNDGVVDVLGPVT